MRVTAQQLEQELERFERDTAHLRNGKRLKLDARIVSVVLAKYLDKLDTFNRANAH